MGMQAVGYYDLSPAGFPLHATAFRPVSDYELQQNPFRIFTSLLRLELLPDKIREIAESVLSRRQLFSPRLMKLMELAEDGKMNDDSHLMPDFIHEAVEVFRWHSKTIASRDEYFSLKNYHPVVADVVGFPGAHINHLTPRTLDIDLAQSRMRRQDMPAKEHIEGPPRRECAVLLRQTSFKAVEESIKFQGSLVSGVHCARFGEVEQRGAAMTRSGRRLYDHILTVTKAKASLENQDHDQALRETFEELMPDNWMELRRQGLVHFRYTPTPIIPAALSTSSTRIYMDDLISQGLVHCEPIVYEDFLPTSAAGIFSSNLSSISSAPTLRVVTNARQELEDSLGCSIMDEFDTYELIEAASVRKCEKILNIPSIIL